MKIPYYKHIGLLLLLGFLGVDIAMGFGGPRCVPPAVATPFDAKTAEERGIEDAADCKDWVESHGRELSYSFCIEHDTGYFTMCLVSKTLSDGTKVDNGGGNSLSGAMATQHEINETFDPAPGTTDNSNWAIDIFNGILSWILSGLSWLVQKISTVIVVVLDMAFFIPDSLKDVWQSLVNTANIILAGVLVAVATMMILGINQNNYTIKKFLPGYIVALVMINLSWVLSWLGISTV